MLTRRLTNWIDLTYFMYVSYSFIPYVPNSSGTTTASFRVSKNSIF